MPEGPELFLAAELVRRESAGVEFEGVSKSEATKLPLPPFPPGAFRVGAESRGKELLLSLLPLDKAVEPVHLLFHFGMSGSFGMVGRTAETPKHAHLRLHAVDGRRLCFVDVRRFGSWKAVDGAAPWDAARGPCVIREPALVAQRLRQALEAKDPRLRKPLCQVLLDQSLFNGLGNYLRAEVMLRAGVDPFRPAEEVLASPKGPAVVELASQLPQEVLALSQADPSSPTRGVTYAVLETWLRCYQQPGMYHVKDGNARMVWFARHQLSTASLPKGAQLLQPRLKKEPGQPSPKKKLKMGIPRAQPDTKEGVKKRSGKKKLEEVAVKMELEEPPSSDFKDPKPQKLTGVLRRSARIAQTDSNPSAV